METLLVLPILLMLLGGLFVVGDLIMGRLLAHEMDRTLAWRANDRFSSSAFDENAFSHVTEFYRLRGMPGLFAFKVTDSEMNNYWSSVFSGRSDVEAHCPWWVALINTQDAVMGDPSHPNRMEDDFKLNSVDGDFAQAARAYVLRHRDYQMNLTMQILMPYPTPSSYRSTGAPFWRGNTPSGLMWLDIAGDKLAGKAVNREWTGGGYSAYNRNPNAIVVSGDHL